MKTHDVFIVGGGPTGLAAALLFGQHGYDVGICEAKPPHSHSRSIGIHPPSLEFFDQLGLSDHLVKASTPIRFGQAYVDESYIGTLDFEVLPAPYRFIATLAQHKTEHILRDAVSKHPDITFYEETRCVHIELNTVTLQKEDQLIDVAFKHLIGADGKNSFVREQATITIKQVSYPDVYLMGDDENCALAQDTALIYLHRDGLVESFPHSNGVRRWVVKTSSFMEQQQAEHLCGLIAQRTGHSVQLNKLSMTSAFGTSAMLADVFAKGNIWLAGDAAHVVSPIGGQGMNLGWLDLPLLLECISHSFAQAKKLSQQNKRFTFHRKKAAWQAMRRAEFNMSLGRSHRNAIAKKILAELILNTPLSALFARLFSMRYL